MRRNNYQVPELTIEKIKRSWFIMAGKSQLAKFRDEQSAREALEAKRELFLYWAGSASVQFENMEKKIVYV